MVISGVKATGGEKEADFFTSCMRRRPRFVAMMKLDTFGLQGLRLL